MASVGKYLILSVLVAVAFAGPVKDRPKTLVPEWTSTAKLGVDPIQVKLQDLGLTLNLTAVEEINTMIYYKNKTKSSQPIPSYIYKDNKSGNELILKKENDHILMNGYIDKNMYILPSEPSKGLHMVKKMLQPDIIPLNDHPESDDDSDLELELLMVVDSVVYEQYGSDKAVIKHLYEMINDTNEAYKKLPDPILINLKGVHICRSPEEDPIYITEYLLEDDSIDPEDAVVAMNMQLSHDRIASKYDSVMMWSGRDLDSGDALGISMVGGACRRITHSGIIHDQDEWEQHDVLGHELGHQLGAKHDELTSCHGEEKIMAEVSNGELEWSECSEEYISSYINSRRSYCLRTKNVPDGPLILNSKED